MITRPFQANSREFLSIRSRIALPGLQSVGPSFRPPFKTLPRDFRVFRTVNGLSAPAGGLPPSSSGRPEISHPLSRSAPGDGEPVMVWPRLTILSGWGLATSDPRSSTSGDCCEADAIRAVECRTPQVSPCKYPYIAEGCSD